LRNNGAVYVSVGTSPWSLSWRSTCVCRPYLRENQLLIPKKGAKKFRQKFVPLPFFKCLIYHLSTKKYYFVTIMRPETRQSMEMLFTAKWNLPKAAKNCGLTEKEMKITFNEYCVFHPPTWNISDETTICS